MSSKSEFNSSPGKTIKGFRSLTTRYIFLGLSIVSLIALFTAISFLFTSYIDDDARRVNIAGRERMLSFKMAWLLNKAVRESGEMQKNTLDDLKNETIPLFEESLYVLRDGSEEYDLKPLPRKKDLVPHINILIQKWQSEIKPLLTKAIKDIEQGEITSIQEYNVIVRDYVNEIDTFVNYIVKDYGSELRIYGRLRIAVVILSILVFIALGLLVKKSLIIPILRLRDTAEQIKKGNFNVMLEIKSNDEIGLLTDNFNQMARTLHILFNEKMRHLKNLEVLHQNYESLVNSIDGIVWESDARTFQFSFVSKKAEKILGYPVEMWLKDPMFCKNHIHPDDQEGVISFCMKAASEKRDHEIEYQAIAADGRIVWLRNIVTVVVEDDLPVKLRGVMVDITEHKRSEETRAFLANITEHATDAIVGLDLDTKIVTWNRGAERIFGYSAQEILGKPWFLVVPEEAKEACRERFKRAALGGFVETEETVRVTKDGRQFPAEMTLTALKDEKGNHIGFVSITRDITERKKFEEQLRHVQKMEAIGQLAGGVAHEFNNILTAIIGYGEILRMNIKEDDPLRRYIEQILASSERAAGLTQGLLTYSRKQVTAPSPVNLNEVIKKMEGLLSRIIGEDIELRTVLTDKDLTVMADRGQIEQVIMNLVTNARDAMPEGGSLSITTELVEIDRDFINNHGYGESGMYALITVTDTGMGIDKKMMDKIFEPFFTTKEIGKGTGLGLAMVYGIIKQHDGYINVYSEPGKGTIFKIYLPVIKAKTKEKEPSTIQFPVGGTETVLVAEDDKALRKLIKTVLSEFGYNVIDAVDGEDAMRSSRRTGIRLRFLSLML